MKDQHVTYNMIGFTLRLRGQSTRQNHLSSMAVKQIKINLSLIKSVKEMTMIQE